MHCLCVICNLPAGENDYPNAQISHAACAIEESYGSRGENLTEGIYAEIYRKACEKRTEQINA